jgi:hypothetical protein
VVTPPGQVSPHRSQICAPLPTAESRQALGNPGDGIAAHLADKAAGTVTGVTDDELEAALDRYKAGEPWA